MHNAKSFYFFLIVVVSTRFPDGLPVTGGGDDSRDEVGVR